MRNPTPKSRTSLSLRFLAWTTVLLICLCGPGCRNEKAPPAESSGSGTESALASTLPELSGPETTDTDAMGSSDTTTETGTEDTALPPGGGRGTTTPPRPGTKRGKPTCTAATLRKKPPPFSIGYYRARLRRRSPIA